MKFIRRHCSGMNGWAELESKLSFFSGSKCLGRGSLSNYNITGTGYSTVRIFCKIVSHLVLHTSIAEIVIHRKYSVRTTRSQLFFCEMTRTFRSVRSSILQDLSYENFHSRCHWLRTIFSFCYVWQEGMSCSTHYWNWVNPIFAFTEMLVALS